VKKIGETTTFTRDSTDIKNVEERSDGRARAEEGGVGPEVGII
jgi:hypothetical protein